MTFVAQTKPGSIADATYLGMLSYVMRNGVRRSNRTGVDTLGVFGFPQFRYDMRDGFPLLTTKKILAASSIGFPVAMIVFP